MDAKSLSVDDFYKFPVKLLESIGCFLLPKSPKSRREKVRIALMRCFFWFSMFAYSCGIVFSAVCVALNLDDQELIAKVLPTHSDLFLKKVFILSFLSQSPSET
jgi:hypothetical protein